MKRKLTENIPLKIMSVAVGILVWLIVVNIDNPIVTQNFVLQDVEIINKAYVENEKTNKIAIPEDQQNPVRISITGERKTVSRLTVSDITAVADLQQAVSLDTDPVMVPIVATCNGISSNNIRVSPQNLSVHLEDKQTQEFPVNVTVGETKPGKGYDIGVLSSNPEKVKITGPQSLISKINKVNAYINIEGETEDVSESVELTIYDKNEEELTETQMKTLTIDNSGKVTVSVKLWKVRTDVKIVAADHEGEPAEGYQVDSIKTVPDTVSVAGSDETLADLAEMGNTLWIPAESINVEGASSDVEEKVSLTDLLPEGLKLISDSSEDVWVTANILPVGGHVYDLDTGEITVKNTPDDLQVTFETARIEIRVKADEEETDGDSFNINAVKASVDLDGMEEGSYEVPVTILLPDGYELVDEVTAEVNISEFSSVDESDE